jgi:hypothetical protein
LEGFQRVDTGICFGLLAANWIAILLNGIPDFVSGKIGSVTGQ